MLPPIGADPAPVEPGLARKKFHAPPIAFVWFANDSVRLRLPGDPVEYGPLMSWSCCVVPNMTTASLAVRVVIESAPIVAECAV